MARPLRIEYPGAFYHVMHRGNAGSDIFKSVRDREKFLEYVGKAVSIWDATLAYPRRVLPSGMVLFLRILKKIAD
jgi:hypothetical protein